MTPADASTRMTCPAMCVSRGGCLSSAHVPKRPLQSVEGPPLLLPNNRTERLLPPPSSLLPFCGALKKSPTDQRAHLAAVSCQGNSEKPASQPRPRRCSLGGSFLPALTATPMTGKRQVIVAVDAGEPVQVAFKWALANLLRPGDHLALVNVRHQKGTAIPGKSQDARQSQAVHLSQTVDQS